LTLSGSGETLNSLIVVDRATLSGSGGIGVTYSQRHLDVGWTSPLTGGWTVVVAHRRRNKPIAKRWWQSAGSVD